MAIGSPEPTPHTDQDVDVFEGMFDDESFPAIKIDRCGTAVDVDEQSKRPEDRSRNDRSRDNAAATKDGASARSSTSNHAKTDRRFE